HRLIFELPERHAVFLEEPDEVLAGDAAILGTGNAIAAKAAGVEPFADGAGCNFADLSYLSSSEDRPHGGLSNQICVSRLRGFVGPSRSSPLRRWSALLAIGSMTGTTAIAGSGYGIQG